MKLLRVLHVLDHSQPHVSGYAMRSQAIIHLQPSARIMPVVLTSPRHGNPSVGEEPETFDGIRYYRSYLKSRWAEKLPFLRERHQMRIMARRIEEVARQEQVDLIHAHSPSLNGFPACAAARKLGLPVVYEIRAFWEDAAVDQRKFREGSALYRISRAMETRLVRKVDRVCVICEGIRSDLVARGIPAAKIASQPNGVEIERFTQRISNGEAADTIRRRFDLDGKRVIGFIGSFYRYEGLELLVQAVATQAKRFPDLRVLLVGAGEVDEELRQQVRDAGLDQTVLFAGRVPSKEVADYYDVMDIMVYPRLARRITELTTPLKPLEAMAMGKIVVGSNVAGIAELVSHGNTGYLFQAGDRESLSKLLEEILSTPDHQGVIQNARDYLEASRSWPKIVESYRDVYEDACSVAGTRSVRTPAALSSTSEAIAP